MKRFGRGALGLLAVLVAAGARAQVYGPDEQVMTIGAAKFRAERSEYSERIAGSSGYQFPLGPPALSQGRPTVGHYRAPVAVPEGARLTRLCMWVYDADEDSDVTVSLALVKLAYGGESPAVLEMSPLHSSLAPGYHSYCEDLDLRVTGAYDVDGDAVPDPVAWYWRLTETLVDGVGFGGVQITWRRELSEPPATPTFGDVSESHPFFQFIEALAKSGITGGCGSGNFCPNNPLTRGQMAVFLAKALGLHWPN
jgi:S-layer homology domain